MTKKLVYGVGINDADYPPHKRENGKITTCNFYSVWTGMIKRCYCNKFHQIQPTYIGCTVSDEWLTFSNFKNWMEKQDWKGKQLDKDILVKGNKTYSPETCVFVDKITNGFTVDQVSSRGAYPVGVHLHKQTGRFRSGCRNPFSKNDKHLGLFKSPEEAHQAWRKRKHELALQLADLQTDDRVAQALRTRYL